MSTRATILPIPMPAPAPTPRPEEVADVALLLALEAALLLAVLGRVDVGVVFDPE
jgi:hypothetical protein